MSNDPIHEAVRNHYGAIARSVSQQPDASCCGSTSATTSCCGSDAADTSECGGSRFYDMQLLEGLPVDVTGLSMGCGGTQSA